MGLEPFMRNGLYYPEMAIPEHFESSPELMEDPPLTNGATELTEPTTWYPKYLQVLSDSSNQMPQICMTVTEDDGYEMPKPLKPPRGVRKNGVSTYGLDPQPSTYSHRHTYRNLLSSSTSYDDENDESFSMSSPTTSDFPDDDNAFAVGNYVQPSQNSSSTSRNSHDNNHHYLNHKNSNNYSSDTRALGSNNGGRKVFVRSNGRLPCSLYYNNIGYNHNNGTGPVVHHTEQQALSDS